MPRVEYVGKTKGPLRKRYGGHRAAKLRLGKEERYEKSHDVHFAKHFGGECQEEGLGVQVLEMLRPKVHEEAERYAELLEKDNHLNFYTSENHLQEKTDS